jgi:hypothetical protein
MTHRRYVDKRQFTDLLASAQGVFRSISARRPNTTALAASSSSTSISNSPNCRVSGCPPELADPIGAVEVREAEGVKEFGASWQAEGLEAIPQPRLHLVEGQEPRTLVRRAV